MRLATPLVLAVAGCVDTHGSSNFATSELSPSFLASFRDGRIRVSASFGVTEDGETLPNFDRDVAVLDGDDELVASWFGDERPFHLAFLSSWRYRTRFRRHDPDGEAWLNIALNRTVDVSATGNGCIFPAAAEILVPEGNGPFRKDRFSRNQDALEVSWVARPVRETTTTVRVHSTCGDDVSVELDGDPGTFTFPAGAWDGGAGTATVSRDTGDLGDTGGGDGSDTSQERGLGTCKGWVSVTRRNPGHLDTVFTSGGQEAVFLCESEGEVAVTIEP